MRIIELITFLAGGGAERFVVDLSNQLSKNNEVFLITVLDDTKEPEIRNFYRSEITENVNYVNLGIPNGFKFSSQMNVLRRLKELDPDIIHIHMIPTLKYCALGIGVLAFSKKVYFSVHSDLFNGYNKGILKMYCNTLGRFNRFKLSCLSEKNYTDFKTFYPYTTIRCIPNGRAPIIASNQFEAVKKEMESYKKDGMSKLLIHVARCHPVKNQLLLINAINSIVSRGVNIDLVIIGGGFESPEGRKIKAAACQRIHFIGQRKNVGDYMLNADIFCLSSDYEGMPITLLEAFLAGVPAVSTPVCGSVDLIKNGVNGYVSQSHKLEDYTTAMIKALNDFNTIKANAMNMMGNSPYSIASCAEKYIEYFKE